MTIASTEISADHQLFREKVADVHKGYEDLKTEIGKVVIGQQAVVDLMIISMFTSSHSLLMGVPGLAKTLLVHTLADATSLDFTRVQFTPDMMPSDLIGTEILQEDRATGQRAFKFVNGPLFTNLLLADEINRTTPKTQAALLQSMQERQVSAAGTTYKLEPPFLVFATQNPIEQEGTYPLPEAQLDRFLFRIDVTYPKQDEEIRMVMNTTSREESTVLPVYTRERLLEHQALVRAIPASETVVKYAVSLVRSTRPHGEGANPFASENIRWGAGPRASQSLILAGKARALLDGRYAVEKEDIVALAQPILVHRIMPTFQAEAEGITSAKIIQHCLDTVRI
ncbi:MoxR family ATPase [Sulfidibacter corallicola]|uniref:MoxR family ATPase n=1 Tax=Sulfidibacter corallicola TaxID=2818388 RepID=A0A8A4TCS2_SULCO|nr:MoxR family ATPase [Sulfidibacter corallicola]QTD47736.1 MoxR family ATPase [Sulfidibacter corallicola]